MAVAVTWHLWLSVIIIHPCCCHGGGNNTYKTNVNYKKTKLKEFEKKKKLTYSLRDVVIISWAVFFFFFLFGHGYDMILTASCLSTVHGPSFVLTIK